MNLVNLYEYIKQIALSIPIVKSYYNTSVYECWDNQEVKYGSVAFVVKSTRKQNGISRFDCVLYYGDRLNENRSNRDSIQSDAIGVINNIINRLNCSSNIEYVATPVQSIIFEQQFADELAGAYANLTIDLQSNGDCCDFNLFDDYYTKEESDNRFQPKGEYVTDDELNEALAGLGGTDIPTVVISNGDANSTTPTVTSGDLDAVINAISENTPYIAYFVNVGTRFGSSGKKYLIQAADFNAVNNTGSFHYHTEINGGNHMDVQIFFRKENDSYVVFNITRYYHYYQEQLTSGVNIKTINGQSVLGSGDIVIESGDPDNYYNKEEIDAMIGDVNRILDSLINDVDTDAIKNQLNNILYVI